MTERQFHRTEDIPFNEPVPDGNTGGNLYRMFISSIDKPLQILHGFDRPCQQVYVVRATAQCFNPKFISSDDSAVRLQFFDSELEVVLRLS